jgi:hypothetical protein
MTEETDAATAGWSLDALSDSLAAATPRLDAQTRPLAQAVYRCLARGRPVTDTLLAGETAITVDAVRATLDG